MKKVVILSVLILSLSGIACSLILVKPSILFRNEGSIKVKGSAAELVVSDLASWNAAVSVTDANIANAYSKIIAIQSSVLEFLNTLGVRDGVSTSLTLTQIFKKNENGYDTAELAGYQYELGLYYKSQDIKLVETLYAQAASLAKKGLNIKSNAPQYFYTNLESLKLKLMAKASENAKERAKLLVSGSGSQLGKVIAASQGVFQITRPLSTETSDWGVYDTSSYEKQVNCVVTMEFEVER